MYVYGSEAKKHNPILPACVRRSINCTVHHKKFQETEVCSADEVALGTSAYNLNKHGIHVENVYD